MEDIINQYKKRKTLNDFVSLTQQDARKILQPLTKDQLIDNLQTLITDDVAALSAVRSIADTDPSHRKLFIRSIGWDTTTTTLKSVFEQYGEVEEGLLIVDKATNKSKGYGFVTFKHVDGAVKALVEHSKKIDGYPAGTGCNPRGPHAGRGQLITRMSLFCWFSLAVLEGQGDCAYGIWCARSSGYPAAQEYPGQNSYKPLMNRLPPIQGGYADNRNYGLSSGYPTQPNMPPAGQRGPHEGAR
nr:UBP1-associated protein 2C-like [Tanacetum cinerariifolium]